LSNLLKGFFVSVDDDSRLVDTSELLMKRIQEEEERRRRLEMLGFGVGDSEDGDEDSDGFSSGIPAANIDALLDENPSDTVIKAIDTSELDALNEQIDMARDELESLRSEASGILDEANQTAEIIKGQAYETGSREGYQDGYAKGMAEAEELKQQALDYCNQCEMEYQSKLEEIEPRLVDTITDIYERIFKYELDDYSQIVLNILVDTINDSGASKNIVVHISKETYKDIIAQKDYIFAETGMLEGSIDFIMDATLPPSGCMIETENGVYDCSLDTELKELKKKLMLLSFRKD